MKITEELATKVVNLNCGKHLPFPESRGEYHHGYYQAIRDALEVINEYEKSIHTRKTPNNSDKTRPGNV